MKKELHQDSFVHYEEQRQMLLRQMREWGAPVEKSSILAGMEGDERYPEMCRDMFSPAFVNTHKGDQAKEYQILLAACQMQVRHLGKVSGKAEHAPILMRLLPVTNRRIAFLRRTDRPWNALSGNISHAVSGGGSDSTTGSI